MLSKKLTAFLKQEGVLDLYSTNTKEHLIVGESIIDDVGSGFFWMDSPEGHEFWSELAQKFRRDFVYKEPGPITELYE